MTPEERADEAIETAHKLSLLGGDPADAKFSIATIHRATQTWHAIISLTVLRALCEARDRCTAIDDRIAIGYLIVGSLTAPAERPSQTTRTTIPCVICQGEAGRTQGCPGCNGAGIHTLSGEMPENASGYLAVKPCGCGIDWVGDGIDPKFLSDRRAKWEALGYQVIGIAWSEELGKKMTEWAGCQHGQRPERERERLSLGAPDLADTPPSPAPETP